MHIRLKFRSHRNLNALTHWDNRTPALVDRGVRDRKYSREAGDAQWREKVRCMLRCPYRKPTQVDEERILRPTGEGLLRNSAKLPRNFGIRGAPVMGAAENRPKRLFTKNTGLC